jgi:Tol biopolymer transport system component
LRREFRRAAEPADPSGVFDRILEKKVRRRIVRKTQVVVLTAVVVAGSAGGTFALAQAFGVGRGREHRPAASPGGVRAGRIAFMSDHDGSMQIYTMNPDGSGIRQLTAGQGVAMSPAWSPDGHSIAYTVELPGDKPRAWIMNGDGSDPHQLTDAPGPQNDPAWSPDGSKVLFVSPYSRSGATSVFVVNRDGGGLQRLLPSPPTICEDRHPAWSPDGTWIALERSCPPSVSLVLVHPDGSGGLRIADGLVGSGLSWSPDGSQIALCAGGRIEVVDIPGRERVRLTEPGSYDPTWSPDGTEIAFDSKRSGRPDIYRMNADGSSQTNLTNSPANDFAPAWQPSPTGSPVLLPTSTPATRPPTPTARPAPRLCDAGTAVGDFDGDGRPDRAQTAIVESASDCSPGNVRDGEIRVSVKLAAGPRLELKIDKRIQPAGNCSGYDCGQIEPFDFNGDGRDELAVLTWEGASTDTWQILGIPGGGHGLTAFTVGPGQPIELYVWGTVGTQYFMSCDTGSNRRRELIATSYGASADWKHYNGEETVFVLEGIGFRVVGTRSFVVPFSDNPLPFRGRACGSLPTGQS